MKLNPSTPEAINNLSVRLSVAGAPVGSGFVISSDDNEYCYVLTARHCFENLAGANDLSIDWYDYDRHTFIALATTFNECSLLAFPAEETYDGAILVIPRSKLPVSVPSVVLVPSVMPDQAFRFRGFPNGLSNEEPEELEAKVVYTSNLEVKLKVQEDVEDNSTSAYSNVKGFSGSGLYQKVGNQVYVAGIVIGFQSGITRIIAHSLLRINELLREKDLPELLFSDAPTRPSNADPIDSGDFVAQCKRLLDDAVQSWEDMRPKQGIGIVRTVRKNISDSAMSTGLRNSLLARVNYLEALIASDLRDDTNVDDMFIIANALVPNLLSYQERAAEAYLNMGEIEKAYEIAEAILKTNPYNPYAWLVLIQLEPTEIVPEIVQSDPVYKVGYLTRTRRNKGDGVIRISDYSGLFRAEIDTQKVPVSINRRRIYYWSYIAQFAFHELISRLGHIHNLERPKELLGNPQLQFASDLLERICERVERSDLKNDNFFQIIRFDYCYCRYFLSDDATIAREMAHELFELFIGTKKAIILPYAPNRPAAIESIPHRLIDLLLILYSQKEGQKMLDAIAADTIHTNQPIINLFKGMAYGLMGDSDQQVESLKVYLEKTDNLDELETINFLDPIRILLQNGASIDFVQQLAIESKTFVQPYYKLLLEAFLWSVEKGPKDRARSRVEEIRKHWDSLSDTLRKIVARMHMQLAEWTVARELLAQICDEAEESEELGLYIIAIYNEQRDVPLFLKLAADWRANFLPNSGLTYCEMAIHRPLHNYTKMEEVAAYGLAHFPDSVNFWWDLVSSLHSQGASKKEALLAQLAHDEYLFNEEFTGEGRFVLAHVCFTAGLPQKGLELSYRALKANSDNPAIQHKYFSLSTNYQAFDSLTEPEVAHQDMVVRLRFGNNEQLIELTEEAISYNRIARAVIGHRVGESFKLHDSITGRDDEEYVVARIFDKYTGQIALIAQKAEHPLSGLPMKSFKIATDEVGELDFDGFHKQLQDLFGAEGTKRKIIIDDLRQKFTQGAIGFTELCQNAFGGDPIAAWNYATSDQAGGFPVCPLCLQNTPVINDDTEYVLDFTSVLSLFFLSKLQPIAFQNRFIVSQFLIDYVGQELETAQHERGSKMSAEIFIDRTIPHFYPEDQQERKNAFYQELLDWIFAYCKPDYAPERLSQDFMDQGAEDRLFSEDKAFSSSFMDSLLLAVRPNRVLVTDDMLPFRSMSGGGLRLITVEHFLRIEHSQSYLEHLWIELVGFNFRGLTLGSNQLYQVFKNSLLESSYQKNYFRATFSFSQQYNPEPKLLLGVILFLKRVYTEDFSLEYKRQVSQALLRRYFIGSPSITERKVLLIHQRIDREFQLMGDYGDYVKDDFNIVLEN